MSEETHDAAVRGPLAIRLAVLVSGIIGWMLSITFCFCLTDDYLDSIVGSPTGLPIAQIFLNAGGRSGGTGMLFFVILVQFFTGASAMLANARMTVSLREELAALGMTDGHSMLLLEMTLYRSPGASKRTEAFPC